LCIAASLLETVDCEEESIAAECGQVPPELNIGNHLSTTLAGNLVIVANSATDVKNSAYQEAEEKLKYEHRNG